MKEKNHINWLNVFVWLVIISVAFWIGSCSATKNLPTNQQTIPVVQNFNIAPVIVPTQIPVVATPTIYYPTIVEERIDNIQVYGAGEAIEIRLPLQVTSAGIKYQDEYGNSISQLYCPTVSNNVCMVIRPVLTRATLPTFEVAVQDVNGWHYFSANPSDTVIQVISYNVNGLDVYESLCQYCTR